MIAACISGKLEGGQQTLGERHYESAALLNLPQSDPDAIYIRWPYRGPIFSPLKYIKNKFSP